MVPPITEVLQGELLEDDRLAKLMSAEIGLQMKTLATATGLDIGMHVELRRALSHSFDPRRFMHVPVMAKLDGLKKRVLVTTMALFNMKCAAAVLLPIFRSVIQAEFEAFADGALGDVSK